MGASKGQLLVFSNATDGRDEEFNTWYDEVHVPEVLEVDGVSGASRDPWGSLRRGASASTKISRKDFGLLWNKALETGGMAVADEVQINLEVEMVKK